MRGDTGDEFDLADVQALAKLLKFMGVTTRLDLFLRVASRGGCVNDMAARTSLDQPLVSQHLARLAEHGLVEYAQRGGTHVYRLSEHIEVCCSAGAVKVTLTARGAEVTFRVPSRARAPTIAEFKPAENGAHHPDGEAPGPPDRARSASRRPTRP